MVAHPKDLDDMLVKAERARLRVTVGLQTGAEMSLTPGIYTVGSDENCDVVLDGDDLAPRHITVRVDEDTISVKAEDGSFWDGDGMHASGDEVVLDGATAINLGTVCVAIGPRDTDWAALGVPETVVPEAPVEEVEETEETDAPVEGEETVATDATPEIEPDPVVEEPKPAKAPARPRRRRRGLLLATTIIVFALVGGEAAYLARSVDTPVVAEAPAVSAAELAQQNLSAAEQVVDDMALREVRLDVDTGGRVVISGFVPTAQSKQSIEDVLTQQGVAYVDNANVVEDMLSGVRKTLDQFTWPTPGFGDHIEVKYTQAGFVQLDGYIHPDVDRTTLERRISQDMPGVRGVQYHNAELSYWRNKLTSAISDAGLGLWLKVETHDGNLHVSGKLTPDEAQNWRKVGEGFVAASRGYPEIEIGVQMTEPAPVVAAPVVQPKVEPTVTKASSEIQPEAPEISVNGVVTTGQGNNVAMLKDGQILKIGDNIDGYKVTEIAIDHVVLSKENAVFTLNVGRNVQ